MFVNFIQPELFVELSTEQQQLISGGRRKKYYGIEVTPDITVRGELSTKDGESFPVDIFGFKRN